MARAPRPGEELPIGAVDAWLKAQVPGLEGTPEVTQYSGGASNWTYRLQYPSRDFVLRRPPAGTKAKSAHDMGREHRVQSALRPHFPLVPAMVGLCEDEAILGAPFYVMERVEGVIPRKDFPPGVRLSEAQAATLCDAFVNTLVALHRVSPEASGLASLSRGPGYCRRQVEGWSDRYDRARTWNVPRFRRVRAWLHDHTPVDVAACIIHNDYRFDNLVLAQDDPTRIVGVLDWEMATVGDPLMDLGGSLAYWVEAGDGPLAKALRRQPTHLPGMLTRRGLVEAYLERTGHRPASFAFYEVFGLFRLAVIAQQIYYRYHHGQTRNPAFKNLWLMVHYLSYRCRLAARSGRP